MQLRISPNLSENSLSSALWTNFEKVLVMLILLLIPVLNKIIGSLNAVGGKNIRTNSSSSMFILLEILFTVELPLRANVFFKFIFLRVLFFRNLHRCWRLKYLEFQDGIPGQYWLKKIKRGNSVRLSSTLNTFIIYGF